MRSPTDPSASSVSRIRRAIQAGGRATIIKLNFADPRAPEVAGQAGVDAIWLCNEHSPNDWLNLENQIRAARLHNVDVLVRVAKGSYSDYVRPLEAGATGIIVPHVSSAAEARQIVDWARFQPVGNRAIDGGSADGRFGALPLAEYIRQGNAEKIIVLQIESPQALARVEEIAAVPGVDGLLFGPGDFSHRIGKAGMVTDPEVVEARRTVARTARKHGKFAMTAGLFASADELEREGHQVFGIGADVLALAEYVQTKLAVVELRDLPANGPGSKLNDRPY